MIRYIFEFASGQRKVFEFEIKKKQKTEVVGNPPQWTELSINKCSNCPLNENSHKFCPAAVDVVPLIDGFKNIISHDRVKVTVVAPNRTYFKEVDAQAGLMSCLGLIMAKSDCPHLKKLRGMAHFHLPFASAEETLFRTVGTYFLRQYFMASTEKAVNFDLKNLEAFYTDLSTLNYYFLQRIRKACEQDANLNALVVLHTMSAIVENSLNEQLDMLKEIFCD